jgi:exodeoxyribonuclease VII large subunit
MSTGFFDFHSRAMRGQRGQAAAPTPDAAGNAPAALTVSELAAKVSGAVRAGLPSPVWVKGEVSGYRGPHASGHHYFTLKDAQNQINCVVWAGEARNIRFKWSDGMEVLAYGSVATYPARSQYQLKVMQLQPVGQGALELAFRQLKERLEREGLFSPDRKQPLPLFPRRIAIVTSRGAAGFADMLKVLRRFPWLKLMLFHVPVQGPTAHPAIAAALASLNRNADHLGGIDAILLGRGGGSMEDLWAFNEEVVARAVAASRIPVVTGIGHEVDVSIADLVADVHAHTPTEAARVVTQHWLKAAEFLLAAHARLQTDVRRVHRRAADVVAALRRHELFRRPMDVIVRSRQQQVDDLNRELQIALRRRLAQRARRLGELEARLARHSPTARLADMRRRLDRLATRLAERHPRGVIRLHRARLAEIEHRLGSAARQAIETRAAALDALTRQLDAVGPLQVLRRGYSITLRLADRAIIRNAADIRPGDRMLTRFAEGEIEWTAGDGQMRLF